MRNLAIVITVGAILAVTTAGYYGSDMLLGGEDSLLAPTDENNSATEQASGQDNVLSENREIKGRDDQDAETEEGVSADTTSKDGIIISSNLVAGKNARIVIYDGGNRVTGETVYLNGEEIGETSQTGALTFEVPNKEEITVEASYDSITETVEGYAPEISMSFSFSDTVYQGRSNTLTVTRGGSAVNGATVYANGVEQSQTDSSGQIEFTIPEEDSVTVKAVKGNSDSNKSFTAEVPPIDITWFGPSDGASINDYKTAFDFSVDLQELGTVNLTVDGNQKIQQDFPSGTYSITEELKFENSGTRQYTLEINTVSETRIKTGRFTTQKDMPPIDITIDSPTDGAMINDYKTAIQYGFDAPEDFNYNISIDDKILSHEYIPEGRGSNLVKNVNCIESGQHSIKIEAQGENSDAFYSKEVSYETGKPLPIADLIVNVPEEDEALNNPSLINYAVTSCRELSFSSKILQGNTIVKTIQNLSANDGEIIRSPEELSGIDSGKYNLSLSVENQTHENNLKVPFEVN